jgi:hypothetical protein
MHNNMLYMSMINVGLKPWRFSLAHAVSVPIEEVSLTTVINLWHGD